MSILKSQLSFYDLAANLETISIMGLNFREVSLNIICYKGANQFSILKRFYFTKIN